MVDVAFATVDWTYQLREVGKRKREIANGRIDNYSPADVAVLRCRYRHILRRQLVRQPDDQLYVYSLRNEELCSGIEEGMEG